MTLRHSGNHNLHLYYNDTFEGFPTMHDKGPFIREYLQRLHETIQLALDNYSRVFAFRVDLRFPIDQAFLASTDTNEAISYFIESFKAKIEHNRRMARQKNKYAPDCKVRYVWGREFGEHGIGKAHYHAAILLNREAYHTLGNFNSEQNNVFNRLKEAWASALGLPVEAVGGLVNISKGSDLYLSRDDRQSRDEFFHRASYLCKAATKVYGDRQHGFGSSRG